MRIQHKRPSFSGTEIHSARELEFVDGIADTPDSPALAAALSVKGYSVIDEEPVKAKRSRKPKPREVELTEDVAFGEQAEPEITDDVPLPPDVA
ncbi:hypothetical protein [Gordonia insulae]|uniref:Uncharacterized protein n=1 Tax=Gordonia insulae TaxID=2420509 RepID=A0A3G8JG85_9ACTN|nr:hypothetical protein [Gordonia insulae]AZG43449.1 hypothetical protein D7316_00013 [Gordonia insulae]